MDKKFSAQGLPVVDAEQMFWLGRAQEAPEPRDSIRRPFGLKALVNHGLTYSTPWRVRDLSMTGAFVEMDVTQLPEGAYVELVLRYRYEGKSVEHRLPAIVTRIEDKGAGLTFGRYDDQTYTDLVKLLYAL